MISVDVERGAKLQDDGEEFGKKEEEKEHIEMVPVPAMRGTSNAHDSLINAEHKVPKQLKSVEIAKSLASC